MREIQPGAGRPLLTVPVRDPSPDATQPLSYGVLLRLEVASPLKTFTAGYPGAMLRARVSLKCVANIGGQNMQRNKSKSQDNQVPTGFLSRCPRWLLLLLPCCSVVAQHPPPRRHPTPLRRPRRWSVRLLHPLTPFRAQPIAGIRLQTSRQPKRMRLGWARSNP